MKNDIDIEDVLKRYRSDPGDEVKRSVMSRFKQKRWSRRRPDWPDGIWKRPVPFYLLAASVLLAVGLSFFVGSRMNPARPQIDSTGPSAPTETFVDAQELEWEVAPNDVL
jgi:hypothetical protein